jgi:hypothetical protein
MVFAKKESRDMWKSMSLVTGKEYPANLLEQAIEQALSYGCVHLDGVLHCLLQLTDSSAPPASLDLSDRPHLQNIGNQPIDLSPYE